MMKKLVAWVFMVGLPWLMMAQNNNDLYFIPKKQKKEVKTKVESLPEHHSGITAYSSVPSTVVVRDVKGNVRDVDEYNRRYTSRDNKFSIEDDKLYIDEKPYDERGEWVNGFQGSDTDYEYAMRIVKFRNPRFAIPVSSPLYWDVVYGVYPSWDWNVFDDGMYAYVFPTSYNRFYWDWNFSWGFYGPGWNVSWGWNSPWYHHSWYRPYWDYRYYGYCGPRWHYPHYYYPSYGYAPVYRSGHSDYRSGRYGRGSYASSHSRRSGTTSPSYTRAPGGTSHTSASTPIRRRNSSISRVVDGNHRGTATSSSVRPQRPSRNTGSSSTVTTYPARRPGSSYTRSSSTVDRNGSSYNRPSSTRRSSSYNRSSSSRSSSYNGSSSGRINRGSSSHSRSSYSRGSSSYSRGSSSSYSSGSSSRSSGHSSHSGSVRRR